MSIKRFRVRLGKPSLAAKYTNKVERSDGTETGKSSSSIEWQKPFYLDAGDEQFMIMPTKATLSGDIASDWNALFDASKKTMFTREALHQTAIKIAANYNLAYFRGKNGELKRIGIDYTAPQELAKTRVPEPHPAKRLPSSQRVSRRAK